jgi:hypothetical protein
MTSQKPKKNLKTVPGELDVFAVGSIREHWCPSSTYEKLDEVPSEKDKLGEKKIFCVVKTGQTTEDGEVAVYSVLPKTCLSSDLKCLLYPPSKEFQVKTPAVWNEKMFSKNIWPKTSWMEYDVAHVFNKTEETWGRHNSSSSSSSSSAFKD